MKKKLAMIALAATLVASICGAGELCPRNFEWESFKTGEFALERPKWENTAAESSFREFRDYRFSTVDNGSAKSTPDQAKQLEFDLHRFKFSLSRYAFNADRDHTVRPSDLEKQREALIQSLPANLLNSSGQGKFEAIGKIFEPNLNLRIEF